MEDANKNYNKIWVNMGECKICENPQNCADCEFKALIENLPNRDDDEDWINFPHLS